MDHHDDRHDEGHNDEVDYYDFLELHDAYDLAKDETTAFNIHTDFQKDHKEDIS